ncbi:MAG: hormogonium polysaccharide biosynthesis protein HpsA, partial [Cyanobacteria bacterium P01_H01_bin.15]
MRQYRPKERRLLLSNIFWKMTVKVLSTIFQRKRKSVAGYVLPLATALVFISSIVGATILNRAFYRSDITGNFRASQSAIEFATPALDRAKLKLSALFEDSRLPRGLPSEEVFDNLLETDLYTLSDETRLQLQFDFGDGNGGFSRDRDNDSFPDGDGTIQINTNDIKDSEALRTAWRFPVDTDNNGRFDTFILYSISLRSPNLDNLGNQIRSRTPLDARGLPMAVGTLDPNCVGGQGTIASVAGGDGWYSAAGELKKPFFVSIAGAPIADASGLGPDFEVNSGRNAFIGLEYQQDRVKIPLNNNAVVYEDDLEMSPGPRLEINGRIITNGNLLAEHFNGLQFRQVSSPASCFYSQENAKVIVGGNYAVGNATRTVDANKSIEVDLYDGRRNQPIATSIGRANKSTGRAPFQVAYNNFAYETRLQRLVELTRLSPGGNVNALTVSGISPNITVTDTGTFFPAEVLEKLQDQVNPPTSLQLNQELVDQAFRTYFRRRTRRVPFAEVPFNPEALPSVNDPSLLTATLQGAGDTLRPTDSWIFPYNPTDGKSEIGYTGLPLTLVGNQLSIPATEFTEQENLGKEIRAGDRIFLGNNLPELWFSNGVFESGKSRQQILGTVWDSGQSPAERRSQIQTLTDVGNIDRDAFWEINAAEQTPNDDATGGVRLITGGGIYLTWNNDLLNNSSVVWPDYMPQPPQQPNLVGSLLGVDHPYRGYVFDDAGLRLDGPAPVGFPLSSPPNSSAPFSDRPYLKMRATAVYHYRNGSTPIACVNNFYDPTNEATAQASNVLGGNGTVYGPPTLSLSSLAVRDFLNNQAALVYPTGRRANPTLANAMAAYASGSVLSLSQQSSIDATLCGLQILNTLGVTSIGGPLNQTQTPTIGFSVPNNAIREDTLLDAAQVKNLDQDYDPAIGITTLNGKSNLAIEERELAEIRVTVLDLDLLRLARVGSDEYMIPNSGIIYASRDDALPDTSDVETINANNSVKTIS